VGHSKTYIVSKKFIRAEGGIKRVVWLPKHLKEELADKIKKRAEEEGIPDLLDKIADETVGTTEEEILPWLTEKGHPALTMDPMM
jgi:acetyl-CoA synthase